MDGAPASARLICYPFATFPRAVAEPADTRPFALPHRASKIEAHACTQRLAREGIKTLAYDFGLLPPLRQTEGVASLVLSWVYHEIHSHHGA